MTGVQTCALPIYLEHDGETIKLQGRVVAVRNLHSVDLGRSVHISFDKELTEAALLSLVG